MRLVESFAKSKFASCKVNIISQLLHCAKFNYFELFSLRIQAYYSDSRLRLGYLKENSLLTTRSISWLIYLNEEDWNAKTDGGELRTYERKVCSAYSVGSRDGDLQLGWLASTYLDPKERPVFLDG